MRGYNIDDYVGKKYNHLTIIKNLNKIDKHNSKLILCKCDCGNKKEMVFSQVINGQVKTCGCKQGYLSKNSRKNGIKNRLEFYKNRTVSNNNTGHTGISIANGKYRVRIQMHGKSHHIGYFDTLEKAIQARKLAEDKYFNKRR